MYYACQYLHLQIWGSARGPEPFPVNTKGCLKTFKLTPHQHHHPATTLGSSFRGLLILLRGTEDCRPLYLLWWTEWSLLVLLDFMEQVMKGNKASPWLLLSLRLLPLRIWQPYRKEAQTTWKCHEVLTDSSQSRARIKAQNFEWINLGWFHRSALSCLNWNPIPDWQRQAAFTINSWLTKYMGRISTHLLCVGGQFVTQPNKTPLELNTTVYCFHKTQHQSLDSPEFPLKLQTFCLFPVDLVPVTLGLSSSASLFKEHNPHTWGGFGNYYLKNLWHLPNWEPWVCPWVLTGGPIVSLWGSFPWAWVAPCSECQISLHNGEGRYRPISLPLSALIQVHAQLVP
jgi:hypothetical protein